MSLLDALFDPASLTADGDQAVSLVQVTTSKVIDPDTGAPSKTTTRATQWTGKGSLQPAKPGTTTIRESTAGVLTVPVMHIAFLPADASPEPGWVLEAPDNPNHQVFHQVTNPAYQDAGWLLFLAPAA